MGKPDHTEFQRDYVWVQRQIAEALRQSDPLRLASDRETGIYELAASNLMPYIKFGSDPPSIAWAIYAELCYWYGHLPFAVQDLMAVATRVHENLQPFQHVRRRFDGSDWLPPQLEKLNDNERFDDEFSELDRFVTELRGLSVPYSVRCGDGAGIGVTICVFTGCWEITFLPGKQAKADFMDRWVAWRLGSKLWLEWFFRRESGSQVYREPNIASVMGETSASNRVAAIMQHEYKQVRRRIVDIFQRTDPLSIVSLYGDDAYMLEASSVASNLRFNASRNAVKPIVRAALRYWGDDLDRDSEGLVRPVEPIYQAWQEYQRARDRIGLPHGLARCMDWLDEDRRLEAPFHELNTFIRGLRERDADFDLRPLTEEDRAVSVLVYTPEGYWAVDFYEDGTLDVEFMPRHHGPTTGSREWLDRFLEGFEPEPPPSGELVDR